jgi:hypothetical protein
MTDERLGRYEGLWMPDSMREMDDSAVVKLCNGVGPHWAVRFIPQRVWGLDPTPATDIHDVMYSVPIDAGMDWKKLADDKLLENLMVIINRDKSFLGRVLRPLRVRRAKFYHFMVSTKIGEYSFMEGKPTPSERSITALYEMCAVGVRGVDGDTILVNLPGIPEIFGKNMYIRIRGIDTPERKDERPHIRGIALFASVRMDEIVRGKTLRLVNPRREGCYFRLVADVYVNDLDVGAMMIEERFAKPWKGEGPHPWAE